MGPTPFPGERSYEATKPGFSFFFWGGGGHLVFIVLFVSGIEVCFCCVKFSFFSTGQETG